MAAQQYFRHSEAMEGYNEGLCEMEPCLWLEESYQ